MPMGHCAVVLLLSLRNSKLPGRTTISRYTILSTLTGVLAACCVSCCSFRLLSHQPRPADFHCLGLHKRDGRLQPLTLQPANIYGLGLTYAAHIKETSSRFDPDTPPPIFKKATASLNRTGSHVKVPSREELLDVLEGLEPGLGKKVDKNFKELPPLLDYEVELAFVLLEDIDWKRMGYPGYAPRLGYFIANDISVRAIAALGEGQPDRYDYWGASKSFPGFLPVGAKIWIPNRQEPDSIFCTVLTTRVNGELRQKQSTTDLIYTPGQMLLFIAEKYPDEPPKKGDVVLTGTPGGVAMRVPAWKARAADLLGLNRFTRLSALIKSGKKNNRYLKAGDELVINGGMLGKVKTKVVWKRTFISKSK